jgi:insulysin
MACVQAKMLAELFKDDLMELSYYADCAGLSYDFDNNTEGLVLILSGYNDKMSLLMSKVMERFKQYKIDEHRFNVIKDKQLRSYQNWHFESVHSHAMYYVNYITQERIWHADEKIAALNRNVAM